MELVQDKIFKIFRSPGYSYMFNKQNGFFARWGHTREDDPSFSPFGPEILDLEISAGGKCLGNCQFCYKENGGNQAVHNMSFATFKRILDGMPKYKNIHFLTQIAFGIMNIHTNKNFLRMMIYARQCGVIPNYTTHGLDLDPNFADETAKVCGAVAVSVVQKEKTYDAVKMLTDRGMQQVNIHFMLSEERIDEAKSIVDDIATDPRLERMNAIVFLQYKHKNLKSPHHSVQSLSTYHGLVDYCAIKKVRYGFDSCSFPLFAKSVEGSKYYKAMMILGEPCESTLFSSYINWQGKFFPCSFCEGVDHYGEGVSVLKCGDFLSDVWMNKKTEEFRKKILGSSETCTGCASKQYCRSCFVYDVNACKKELSIYPKLGSWI